MAEFVKKVDKNDKPFYLNVTNGNVRVSPETLPVALKEELDLADLGTVIDEESVIKIDGDGVVDADGNKIEDSSEPKTDDEPEPETVAYQPPAPKETPATPAPVRENPYKRTVEASEDGFGFPRNNGKTVDIFDLTTPHTHIRPIECKCVPLSKENYESKSDAEIFDRLVELGLL